MAERKIHGAIYADDGTIHTNDSEGAHEYVRGLDLKDRQRLTDAGVISGFGASATDKGGAPVDPTLRAAHVAAQRGTRAELLEELSEEGEGSAQQETVAGESPTAAPPAS